MKNTGPEKFFGHGGAFFPETITFWGAEVSGHYGWTPQAKRPLGPVAECRYLTYYWQNGIEQTLMGIDYYQQTQDDKFAKETLLPHADAVTEFYDLHYPRDADGRIHFAPAQALETWHEAVNPLPEIAGLQYTLAQLLDLPDRLTTEPLRARWRRMLSELPSIPTGEVDGEKRILPAETYSVSANVENPELYCIFPYKVYGIDKPDLELARRTFHARRFKDADCWHQDAVQMALLGLTEEAKKNMILRSDPSVSAKDSRFPAFWDAFNDWIPDIDHGGNLQLGLQAMLMQTEGRKITLLPAWPKEWDADFRLHAPYRTVVEGTVRGGKIVSLEVTPKECAKDAVVASDPSR